MALKIGVVQPPLRPDDHDPIEFTKNCIVPLLKSCTDVDLYVLPELCPIGYTQHTFENYLDSPEVQLQIDQIMSQTARELKAYIAYGRIDSTEKTIQHEGGSLGGNDRAYCVGKRANHDALLSALAARRGVEVVQELKISRAVNTAQIKYSLSLLCVSIFGILVATLPCSGVVLENARTCSPFIDP